jgi:hypothetical protein
LPASAVSKRKNFCRRDWSDTKPTFTGSNTSLPRQNTFGGRRFEQVAQAGHRAVVQVGRPQPDAVQRHVGVAVGLAELVKRHG